MKNIVFFPSVALFLCLAELTPHHLSAQGLGDYRSRNSSGTWGSASSWERLVPFLIILTQWEVPSTPPSGSDNVYIQSGHTMNMAAAASGSNIYLSGTLSPGSNVLTINGNVYYTGGKISANGSSCITINGNGALTLNLDQATDGTSNKLLNLTINRGSKPANGTVTLGTAVKLKGTLTLSGGTLQSSSNLTLLSDSLITARIASIDTTKADLSGNIKVQRFIPSGDRDWRFITAPVTTSNGIQANWQNTIFITGPVASGGTVCPGFTQNSSDGLDPTPSGSYSLYTYSESISNWVPVSNTLSSQLQAGKGFRLFYRGNRSQGCPLIDGTNAAPASSVLTATGVAGKGTVNASFNNAANGWLLVGNPYPSSINWDASGWSALRTSGANNIDNAVYIYSPAINNYTSYVNGVSDGNGASNIISSGQAFFVKANNQTSVLQFKETYKSSLENAIFGKTKAEKTAMYVSLFDSKKIDGISVYLDANAGKKFDNTYDALKFNMLKGQMASCTDEDSTLLSINCFARSQDKADTVYLKMNNDPGIYRLEFRNTRQLADSYQGIIYLYDSYTSRTILLSETDYTYSFQVGDDPQSSNHTRFMIVFADKSLSSLLPGENETATSLLYPNPLSGNTVYIRNTIQADFTLNIYDLSGKLLLTKRSGHNSVEETDLSLLSPGNYLAEIIKKDMPAERIVLMKH